MQRKRYWVLAIGVIVTLVFAPLIGVLVYESTGDHILEWGAAFITFLCGLLSTFIAAVWEILSQRWSQQTADWIDVRVKSIGYRKKYLEFLHYQNQDFDIKGLPTQTQTTLELERVFVELALRSQNPSQTRTDMLKSIPEEELRRGSHTLWRFLELGDMKHGVKLVILGPPGSGKTTMLRHVTTALSSDEIASRIGDKTPVLLYLRDHISQIVGTPAPQLPDVISSNLQKWGLVPPPGWFDQQLKNGHCLIMLDGLDEVADQSTRNKIAGWVEIQMRIYAKSTFLLTSRPYGYKENPLNGVSVLEVMPFTEKQIERFVYNWYLATEIQSHQKDDPGVRMEAKSGASALLGKLEKSPSLLELAVNPLLLTMITTVHRFRGSLPGKRVDLYKEICEVFLGNRQRSKGLVLDLSPAQKQTVLQKLAYELMISEKREILASDAVKMISTSMNLVQPDITPEQFLKGVENESGLLLERENGIYGFAHKTFQEYLASVEILENRREDIILMNLSNEWWHETIRLYCAQTDASNVITECLSETGPADPVEILLTLGIECFQEARQIRPAVREHYEQVLNSLAEHPKIQTRAIIANALLMRRIHGLTRISTVFNLDTSLVTCLEYELFLHEMLADSINPIEDRIRQEIRNKRAELDKISWRASANQRSRVLEAALRTDIKELDGTLLRYRAVQEKGFDRGSRFTKHDLPYEIQNHLPSTWQSVTFPPGQANQPVFGVVWYNTGAFCKWLTGKLSTSQKIHFDIPSIQMLARAKREGLSGFWVADEEHQYRFYRYPQSSGYQILSRRDYLKLIEKDLSEVATRPHGDRNIITEIGFWGIALKSVEDALASKSVDQYGDFLQDAHAGLKIERVSNIGHLSPANQDYVWKTVQSLSSRLENDRLTVLYLAVAAYHIDKFIFPDAGIGSYAYVLLGQYLELLLYLAGRSGILNLNESLLVAARSDKAK